MTAIGPYPVDGYLGFVLALLVYHASANGTLYELSNASSTVLVNATISLLI